MQGTGLNWKFILRTIGFILVLESLFVFISAGVAYYYQGTDLRALLFSATIIFAAGLALSFSFGFERVPVIGKRESYLSVSLSWLSFALFGALPFYISGEATSFTDAFFESASGITTTGASVFTHIDVMPQGLLFWRSLLQWLGGMGIIVFSIALLPILGGGASHLFDAESSGLTHDKFRPRVTQMAKRLWAIYLCLTFLLAALLYLGPMSMFDAVCHSFSTIATGGFSTKQASVAYWNSPYVEMLLMIFMIIGATNFSLLYFLINRQPKKIFKDEELRWFLIIIFIAALIIGSDLAVRGIYPVDASFRNAFFQVVSFISTTGFSSAGYSDWGYFTFFIFLFIMIVCGCAGSTSGGLKTVRAVVLAKNTLCEFKRLLHPRAVIPVRLNGSALSFGVVQRLLAFAVLYISIIFASWGILTFAGLPSDEALSGSISSLGNVGPGFGSLSASFADVPVFAKWYLSFLMIIGRLELFTFLIILTPDFWKK